MICINVHFVVFILFAIHGASGMSTLMSSIRLFKVWLLFFIYIYIYHCLSIDVISLMSTLAHLILPHSSLRICISFFISIFPLTLDYLC